jgi:hypothetical protein
LGSKQPDPWIYGDDFSRDQGELKTVVFLLIVAYATDVNFNFDEMNRTLLVPPFFRHSSESDADQM